MTITASDVNKLRKQTGAGMMDCKNALVASEGNFEEAVDILRKQGQKIASKRADRDATEGVIVAKVNKSGDTGVIISLNCETDFVAKNDSFISLANEILEEVLNSDVTNNDSLQEMTLKEGISVGQKIIEQTGVIGERLDISMEIIKSEKVSAYTHAGNRLATIVGFKNLKDDQAGKDVAMQVAAMNPIAINEEEVSKDVIERELSIGREQAREEGKPENILDKIAEGKLKKFFKEQTLLNQVFIKDSKKSVETYLHEIDNNISITSFRRLSL